VREIVKREAFRWSVSLVSFISPLEEGALEAREGQRVFLGVQKRRGKVGQRLAGDCYSPRQNRAPRDRGQRGHSSSESQP
jgi:hypothetical protein